MVPQQFRKELGLAEGSEIRVVLEDGELRLTPREAAWKKAQAFCLELRKRSGRTGSVVDELSEERRREAAEEVGA
jgi:hypothetical protein